ncbi:MAG: YfiR family protein [Mariprofundales bacterium]
MFATNKILLIIFSILLLANPNYSIADTVDEYQVKAAFIGHFSHFIQWPEQDSNTTLELCVFAPLEYQNIFELLSSKHTKRLSLRYYTQPTQINDAPLASCHIIFFTKKFFSIQNNIIKNTRLNPILTVGETIGFANNGGIIEFRVERQKIRFSINLDAARVKKLVISSRLLRLAHIVTNETTESVGGAP